MKRSTIQRKLTLEAVNSLHCHATVEEVYEEVSKERQPHYGLQKSQRPFG